MYKIYGVTIEPMRKIILDQSLLNKLVEKIISSNRKLEDYVFDKLKNVYDNGKDEKTKNLMKYIVDNCEIAKSKNLPICQDTGILEVFVKIGKNIFLDFEDSKFENIYDFINQAAKTAYKDGYFRKSVVSALTRKNNGTNTPAIAHTEFVDGANIEFYVVPKGFGSENMTVLKMFNPTASIDEITDFVVKTVKDAGPNPCPPVFLGIGIGGTSEKAVLLAKKAQIGMLEDLYIDQDEKKLISGMKQKLIKKINDLKIGPFGLGGNISVLDVNINVYPTHIAGLPVSISFACWCNRIQKLVI